MADNSKTIARLARQANSRSRTRERSSIGQSTRDKGSSNYAGRQRAYPALDVQFEDIISSCQERLKLVITQSLFDVVDNAQQAAAKGGRMRVNTGFLRASGQGSLGGMPSGPTRPPKDALPGSFTYDEGSGLRDILINMDIDDHFYFGWTAEYARYRELYDGFLEGALQNWQRIVAINTDTVRRKLEE